MTGLLCIALALAADTEHEKILDGCLDAATRAVDLLATVKDRATADAAAPKLRELGHRLKEGRDKLDKLPAPDAEVEKRMADKILPVREKLDREYDRLYKTPEVFDRLADLYVVKFVTDRRVLQARFRVDDLTRALETYRKENNVWPPNLTSLTVKTAKGKGPYLSAASLVDPWDRPYQYDQAGPRNFKERPDVWSEGLRPRDEKGWLGNWPAKIPDEKPEK